jgi:hypothetical protein
LKGDRYASRAGSNNTKVGAYPSAGRKLSSVKKQPSPPPPLTAILTRIPASNGARPDRPMSKDASWPNFPARYRLRPHFRFLAMLHVQTRDVMSLWRSAAKVSRSSESIYLKGVSTGAFFRPGLIRVSE